MTSQLDRQLDQLNAQLIRMGALCENVIALAAKALLEGDMALAAQVADCDSQIDQKEREIEGLCMKLLLQQQPVARDLRTVSAALKMITDMERIGDQGADIAEIVLTGQPAGVDEAPHLGDMARAVIHMVTGSVDAFVRRDLDAARAVIAYDDVVDGLFNQVKAALAEHFRTGGSVERALDLLMIAKYLERIGDHAVNIAEWVLYCVTGQKE